MSEDQPVTGGKEIEFGSLGEPTAEQIGTIYNSMSNASTRNVAKKMNQLGWKVSPSKVSRAKRDGFVTIKGKRPKTEAKNGNTPAYKARTALAKATERVEQLSGMQGSKELEAVREALAAAATEEEVAPSKFDDLMKQSTLQLKEQFSKTTMAAGIMLAEAVILRRVALSLMPKDVGSFLNDMSQVADNLKLTGDDVVKEPPVDPKNMRVIDGTLADGPPTSVLSQRITQFRKAAGATA